MYPAGGELSYRQLSARVQAAISPNGALVVHLITKDQNLELNQSIESHLILGMIGEWSGILSDEILYLTYTIKIDREEPLNRKTLADFSLTPPIIHTETILGDATVEIRFQPSLHHPKIINEILDVFQKIRSSLLAK